MKKYHLSQGCDTLRGCRSYERKACEVCKQRTEQILTISTYGSPPQSETELTFVHENEVYHDKDCVRMRNTRRKGSRPICLVCESEERTLLYARNRTHRSEETEGLESNKGKVAMKHQIYKSLKSEVKKRPLA